MSATKEQILMKLNIKIPGDAVIKVHPDLNNMMAIFDKKGELHWLVISMNNAKGGGSNGKD